MIDINRLGKGWSFPVETDIYGGIKFANYIKSIEDSIRIILSVSPGELLFEPNFGCKINDVVFSPNSPTVLTLAEYYVTESLTMWEPRIALTEVKAEKDEANSRVINISIKYDIPALDASNETQYSMETGEGD